ncbi:MAG: hypothetical protein LBU30_03140, partial [Candidatus Methanoplasma sp.]|nr:hypothetical protein [Candidatus Methanoplasma sp.]
LALRAAALVFGIVSAIVFLLTEDMSLPASATDGWTPLMLVLLVAALAAAFVSFRFDVYPEGVEGSDDTN